MVEVGRYKDIHINWKFFSLKLINEGREEREGSRKAHEMGLKALRVAAAVRREAGNQAVGKIYTAMGARYHHDKEGIDKPSVLREILHVCGFPGDLSSAAEDGARDADIRADMDEATFKVGTDVGVPLIVLEGGKGTGFFGPVMSPAPTGQNAVRFWDAVTTVGSTPGFFELKRTRKVKPLFGERPEI